MTTTIRFDDGSGYERYMGVWSQLVGARFLDWLAPDPGMRWLDVGCGNGAFTETLVERAAPRAVDGIDPSAQQLVFARARPSTQVARFHLGDAMALPFAADAFDVAVMPLVIFFVPEPAVGVAEMTRVVRPGGIVSAYAWDTEGGGFPYHALHSELRDMGLDVPEPPRPEASRLDCLRTLWNDAGLEDITTTTLEVHRTFADFDDYWATIQRGPSVAPALRGMSPRQAAELQQRMRARLTQDDAGRITHPARANAVLGRV